MNATNAKETVAEFLARGGQVKRISVPETLALIQASQASTVASLRTRLNTMRDESVETDAGGAGLEVEAEESSLLDSLFVAPLSFRDRLSAARRARHSIHPCPECGDDLAFKPGQDMCPDCDARLTAKVRADIEQTAAESIAA
jgi:hypothetical protein